MHICVPNNLYKYLRYHKLQKSAEILAVRYTNLNGIVHPEMGHLQITRFLAPNFHMLQCVPRKGLDQLMLYRGIDR